jgi:hypothetical protein
MTTELNFNITKVGEEPGWFTEGRVDRDVFLRRLWQQHGRDEDLVHYLGAVNLVEEEVEHSRVTLLDPLDDDGHPSDDGTLIHWGPPCTRAFAKTQLNAAIHRGIHEITVLSLETILIRRSVMKNGLTRQQFDCLLEIQDRATNEAGDLISPFGLIPSIRHLVVKSVEKKGLIQHPFIPAGQSIVPEPEGWSKGWLLTAAGHAILRHAVPIK